MTLKAFQIFKAATERCFGCRLYILQSHNAGEFMGKKWMTYYQQEGIEHYSTSPYAPGMNSRAERVIKTIVNHASSIQWYAELAEDFWTLAVKASVVSGAWDCLSLAYVS